MEAYLHQAKQPTGCLDQHLEAAPNRLHHETAIWLGCKRRFSRWWWWMLCWEGASQKKSTTLHNEEEEGKLTQLCFSSYFPPAAAFCGLEASFGHHEQWVRTWNSCPSAPLSFSSLVWQGICFPHDLRAKPCWNCSCEMVLSSQIAQLCWLLHLGTAEFFCCLNRVRFLVGIASLWLSARPKHEELKAQYCTIALNLCWRFYSQLYSGVKASLLPTTVTEAFGKTNLLYFMLLLTTSGYVCYRLSFNHAVKRFNKNNFCLWVAECYPNTSKYFLFRIQILCVIGHPC